MFGHVKILTKAQMKRAVETMRDFNPRIKIVTTNGAFDLMHAGHLHSLEQARKQGDVLIVCLNSDASIKRYKSVDRPIICEKERARLLEALSVVNYIVIFGEDDPREILSVIKPDVHVKSKSGYKGIEREVVESNGGKIVLLDDVPGLSTTDIVTKIKRLT